MKVHQITNKYFDNNSYIIEQNNKALIIDPSFEPLKIINFIEEHHLKCIGVMLTHAHNDHIFGIPEILKKYRVPIYCSKEAHEAFNNPFINLSYNEQTIITLNYDAKYLTDNTDYEIEEFKFKAYSFKGHSPGCLVYEFKNFLITGDFLFKRCVGTISYNYSNYEDMINSIAKFNKLYREKDLKVYPGHRETTNVFHELNTNPFLKRPKSIKFLK